MTFIQKLLGRASDPEIDLGPIEPEEPDAVPLSRLDRTRRSISRNLDALRGQRETIIRDLDLASQNFSALAARMNDERHEIEVCIKAMEAAEVAVRIEDTQKGPTGPSGIPGPIGIRFPSELRGTILPDGTKIPDKAETEHSGTVALAATSTSVKRGKRI